MSDQDEVYEDVAGSNLPDSVVVFDGGHNIEKGLRIMGNKMAHKEVDFPHALKRLTMAEYREAEMHAGKKGLSNDYVIVNGAPYVVGETAAGMIGVNRITGPLRYTPDYYGVFMAVALSRLYRKGTTLAVFASHPTGDVRYRAELGAAIINDEEPWCVETEGTQLRFDIPYANTFEEPLGGWAHALLTMEGTRAAQAELNEGDALILDVGGGTTDLQSTNNGEVTDKVRTSVGIGIQRVEQSFETALLHNHAELFRSNRNLPLDLVRRAITTRRWEGGGGFDCTEEVEFAIADLMKAIKEAYEGRGGGPGLWRYIVLTGGGSAMLEVPLRQMLKHPHIIMAESDSTKMHMANVRGGAKLWRLWQSEGWL